MKKLSKDIEILLRSGHVISRVATYGMVGHGKMR